MKRAVTSIAALAAYLACPGLAAAQEGETLTADVVNSEGQSVGSVTFEQVEHGVVITADLSDLPPGPHGFHIHEDGVCETPDFQSAGGHYTPEGHAHGFDNPDGYHVGDLPNLHVGEDGTATAEVFSPLLTLSQPAEAAGNGTPYTLRDESGSAIMVHESEDNYMDADSAGSRIACGVIAEPQG